MLRSTIFLALLSALVSPSWAQEEAGKPFQLRVIGHSVNVRSHPDAHNSRVVIRVPEDTILDALELKGDWYRIEPPPDVFSYVSASYIERTPGTNRGKVNVVSGSLRVRVGSTAVSLDPARCAVQTKLPRDTDVTILGQEGDWYRIVPPAGVYYYVNADFAKPVATAEASALRKNPPLVRAPVVAPVETSEPIELDEPLGQPAEPMINGKPISDGKMPPPAKPREVTPVVPIGPSGQEVASETKVERAKTTDEPVVRRGPFGNPLPPAGQPIRVADTSQEQPVQAKPQVTPPAQKPMVRANPTAPVQASPTPAKTPTQVVGTNQTNPVQTNPVQTMPPVQVPPQTRPMSNAVTHRFMAEGILQPNFSLPMSPQGLRYELRHPGTGRVVGFVEFGAAVQANPTSLVGRYVGVWGQVFVEPQTRHQIIKVQSVTAMPAPRLQTPRRP